MKHSDGSWLRKLLYAGMATCLILALAACSSTEDKGGNNSAGNQPPVSSGSENEPPAPLQVEAPVDLSGIFGSEYIVPHDSGKAVTYVLEAECTSLENKEGTAQSGTTLGKEMATGGIGVSNGGAVWGMNKENVSVNFIIVSDRDVDDAVLTLRVGTEFNMTTEFDASTFTIRWDPVSEDDVKPIADGGAWGSWDALFLDYYETPGYTVPQYECENGYISVTATDSQASGFQDVTVYTHLKLQKGLNCISLITTNSDRPSEGATFYATAPVVDCIKIQTSAQLGLYNPQNNGYGTENACTIES